MNDIDFNNILNRNNIYKDILNEIENMYINNNSSKSIFVYGDTGIGKTEFIKKLCIENNYDIINYDTSDLRNKNIVENISKLNVSKYNVYSMFNNEKKKIIILMDEIDGMNNGDKGGLNSLIKLVRPKKTNNQKKEESSLNPIICIGNNSNDKKIKELMKVSCNFHLTKPTNSEISNIIDKLFFKINEHIKIKLIKLVNGDLRKLNILYNIYKKNNKLFEKSINDNIIVDSLDSINKDEIVKKILSNNINIEKHNILINETDRTTISLLFHENIIDYLNKIEKSKSINFYIKILKNYCYADYIDRITFQKQIWHFNEITSLVKTCYNNLLFINNIRNNYSFEINENVRFTKVLTKYSTEYNNLIFISNLCYSLGLDKKDMLLFFIINEDNNIYDNLNIGKLDYFRIIKYINYLKSNKNINYIY